MICLFHQATNPTRWIFFGEKAILEPSLIKVRWLAHSYTRITHCALWIVPFFKMTLPFAKIIYDFFFISQFWELMTKMGTRMRMKLRTKRWLTKWLPDLMQNLKNSNKWTLKDVAMTHLWALKENQGKQNETLSSK